MNNSNDFNIKNNNTISNNIIDNIICNTMNL